MKRRRVAAGLALVMAAVVTMGCGSTSESAQDAQTTANGQQAEADAAIKDAQ